MNAFLAGFCKSASRLLTYVNAKSVKRYRKIKFLWILNEIYVSDTLWWQLIFLQITCLRLFPGKLMPWVAFVSFIITWDSVQNYLQVPQWGELESLSEKFQTVFTRTSSFWSKDWTVPILLKTEIFWVDMLFEKPLKILQVQRGDVHVEE